MYDLFSSNALSEVDGSGRVSLPPFVRTTLERRTDAASVMIGLHETDACLRAYDRGHAQILHAEHERRRLIEDDEEAHYERARRTFGFVEEASFDSNGTIVLPVIMRRRGAIEGLALFVGAGGTFEIWNPRVALEGDDPDLRELAAWRLEQFLPPSA